MGKKVKDYINALREHEYFPKTMAIIRIHIRSFKKNKYFIPTMAIVLFLIVTLGITMILKNFKGTKKFEGTIATNAAEQDFYDKKYDLAIADYTKLQEKDEWPIYNLKIAEIYSMEGDFIKSNELLKKVYEARNKIIDTQKKDLDKLQIKDKELTNYIVFTSLLNGDYKKAIEYGELFLQTYPNDKNLMKTMFTVYIANGDKDKAKEIIGQYSQNDENASDLASIAKMYMLLDDYDKGFESLKEAWDKDKNEISVFDVIAQIADYDETDILDKISKLEKKDPNELAYKMWEMKIYSMSKDSAKKAEELADKLGGEDVGNENLLLIKASIYQNLGETEKAKEVSDEIIKNNPNSFIGYHAAAWQAFNNENYDEAFKDCEKSVLANRDYSDNYGFLIPEILEKQNKTEESEPYFRTALYKDPLSFNIVIKTAEYYGNTIKDTSKALYYYDFASKLKQNDAEIYYNMALIQINNQRADDAAQLLKKCVSINNKEPKYHRALGTVYLNSEKNDDALKEIKSAYAIDKNDILTLNNAGCYYIAVDGDINRGLVNLKAAYDGINEKTSAEDKDTITANYNRVKNLSDAYNKKNGATLKIPDLKLFY
ncbi:MULTISPECIES: tetratricopeptide repeat protein [unclassified Clostridium]|uniref:tetratricopeptide repeat protein n=1 Tax=unclassified Clostridium TaxID=2614128 RepID=UPI0002981CD3|nr:MULTISPECIES: tetratricopeptide repeat protein [unclassified Clostridium]EKQ53576.1 MAG: hypothetical protein A370_03621 [Clostridium sp. Maddingley MBC34-26]